MTQKDVSRIQNNFSRWEIEVKLSEPDACKRNGKKGRLGMLYSLCLPPTNLTCNLLLLETLLYLPPFIMFSSSFCVQKLSTICTVTLCECVILCNNESLALLSNNPQKGFSFCQCRKMANSIGFQILLQYTNKYWCSLLCFFFRSSLQWAAA